MMTLNFIVYSTRIGFKQLQNKRINNTKMIMIVWDVYSDGT